jgi:iron complex outermembrane receptor protein
MAKSTPNKKSHPNMLAHLLGLSTILSTGIFAIPALAQTSNAEQQDKDVIVVTAQRKSQSAQSVAIALDAVKGSDLIRAGVNDSYGLSKVTPAITITNGGGPNSSIYMRGVGNKTSSSYADPAIAISYDGIYMGRSTAAAGPMFYDLERIEVLKGPQGILYGRNATGGAINIIPRTAKLGYNGGEVTIGHGNYSNTEAQGAYNFALGEDAALRIAGNYNKRDGYNKDGTNDADNKGIRAQFYARVNDDFNFKVGADYMKSGGMGAGSIYVGSYLDSGSGYVFTPSGLDISGGTYTTEAQAYRNTQLLAPGFGFATDVSEKPYVDNSFYGLNAEFNINTKLGKLTIVPGYRSSDVNSVFSVVGFNSAKVSEQADQSSIEARLSGKVGNIEYIGGLYYFNEKLQANNVYNQEFVLPLQKYTQNTKSNAVFGQLTYNVNDDFRLVGGIRFTNDEKKFNGTINNFIVFCGGLPPTTPPASFAAGCATTGNLPHFTTVTEVSSALNFLTSNGWIAANSTLSSGTQIFPLLNGVGVVMKTDVPVNDEGSYSKTTWKASAEYNIAKDSLLYATIETGYRAGGFQLSEGRTDYDPEEITAYTIGSKNRFFDRKLQINVEAFYWKYKDQQITYFTIAPDGTIVSSTENAGEVTNQGFDIDTVYLPTANTRLSLKTQYLDAKYDDLHFITASPRDNFNCSYVLTGAVSGGAAVKDFNCSGKTAIFAPKWTVNVGATQTFNLGSYDLIGSLNGSWRAEQQGTFEFLEESIIPAYWTWDADLTLAEGTDKWSLTAYVNNLADERQMVAPQLAPTGQLISIYNAPRTYGMRLNYKF